MKRLLMLAPLLLLFTNTAKAQGAPGSTTWTGTPHGILLTWSASTTTGVAYNLYRSTVSGGPYIKINNAPITALSYEDLDSNLAVSTTYFYVATATLGASESVYSNQVSVTTPATFSVNPQTTPNLSATNN